MIAFYLPDLLYFNVTKRSKIRIGLSSFTICHFTYPKSSRIIQFSFIKGNRFEETKTAFFFIMMTSRDTDLYTIRILRLN